MKKRFLLILLYFLGYLGGNVVQAQSFSSLFQPLTWEQACAMSARENKLVLVEVGNGDKKMERGARQNEELVNYLMRHVVAIRMDMTLPDNKEFEDRLLLYPYPTYAFFMPYGDLVGIVTPEEVIQQPETLRERLQQAQKMAKEKKSNSRAIAFIEADINEVFSLATQSGKNIFIYVADTQKQSSLLMERNVFNLDRVADFYQSNFISVQLKKEQAEEVVRKFQLKEIPAFLYLNAGGKLLYCATGYCTPDQLLENGHKALEKAKGITFRALTEAEAQEEARQTQKLIFTDLYMPGTAHKELVKTVFADPEVADLFNRHFVSVSRETEHSVLIFQDTAGNEIHRVIKVADAEELIKEAEKVLAGKGLSGMQEEYQRGNRQGDFMEEYILMLARAGQLEEASRITMEYLAFLSPHCLKEPKYWEYFVRYGRKASPEFFEYVLTHRQELYQLHGEIAVREKIAALWIAGAENFVTGGKFDEAGFKEYTKRLRKEKIEGWRLIVRNARMHAAEKAGDWKTFITLAEEKWNEEKVGDAELYRWGVKVFEQCRDGDARYKMARWLVERALEIEHQERLTGKIKISSYKGFFEKLADDLLQKN